MLFQTNYTLLISYLSSERAKRRKSIVSIFKSKNGASLWYDLKIYLLNIHINEMHMIN
jgi:hypothetical protein